MSKITKLGLGIVAFEGNEHIKNITYELRKECDYIVVCLQKTSYHGDPIDESDVKCVEELLEHGFIDDIIWYTPNMRPYRKKEAKLIPRYMETDKRNFILDVLERNGCSHSLVIDSDEFYDKDDFHKAKEEISKNPDPVASYCQYVNYYKDYRHILLWGGPTYVPFICESVMRFNFDYGNFARPADLTRRIYLSAYNECKKFSVIDFKTIKMHHFSWIRKDMEKKFKSWSSRLYFDESVSKRALERYNNFKRGDNAIITVENPDNEIIVLPLDQPVVHPHFALDEEIKEYLK